MRAKQPAASGSSPSNEAPKTDTAQPRVRLVAWQLMRPDGRVMLTTSDIDVARMWRDDRGHTVRACVAASDGVVW